MYPFKRKYWPRRFANIIVKILTSYRKLRHLVRLQPKPTKWIPFSFSYCLECEKWVKKDHYCNKSGTLEISKLKLARGSTVIGTGLRGITKPKPEQFKKRTRLDTRLLPLKTNNREIFEKANYKPPDQGSQGSCTAQCGINDKAFQEILAKTYPKEKFSAAMLYWDIRDLHGWTNEDSGGNMEDIGLVLGGKGHGQIKYSKLGVCKNSTFPYNSFEYKRQPPEDAYDEAEDYKCESEQTRIWVSEIKDRLYRKNLVRVGIPICNNFMKSVYNGGWVPTQLGNIEGYHAVTFVDYDDELVGPDGTKGYYIVMNSWGSMGIQDEGYFMYPYVLAQNLEPRNEIECRTQLDSLDPSPNPDDPEPDPPDPEPAPLPPNIWDGWSGATFFFLVVALVAAMFGAAYLEFSGMMRGAMTYIPYIINYWAVIVGMIWGVNLAKNAAYKYYLKKLMNK